MSSDTIANLFNDPKTLGSLPEADVTGQEGMPGEGTFMSIHLRLQGDTVLQARFETYGCPYCIACGRFTTQWVTGRTVEQALKLEPGDLALLLGGLPLGKEHCANLAVLSRQEALEANVAELVGFAKRLAQDCAGVNAGLILPWSNGPVEGHVNRLKLIKRSTYGRVGILLLRMRLLCAR